MRDSLFYLSTTPILHPTPVASYIVVMNVIGDAIAPPSQMNVPVDDV
jgi:hypothetical protein